MFHTLQLSESQVIELLLSVSLNLSLKYKLLIRKVIKMVVDSVLKLEVFALGNSPGVINPFLFKCQIIQKRNMLQFLDHDLTVSVFLAQFESFFCIIKINFLLHKFLQLNFDFENFLTLDKHMLVLVILPFDFELDSVTQIPLKLFKLLPPFYSLKM